MEQPKILETDVLVVGAGIAGMQAALDAADQGARVVLAEKDASIGGRMINLSKVFPTLDCASCITTPRMASVSHHARIEMLTHTEVLAVERSGDGFLARLRKKPRYVDEANCIGCRLCEEACSEYQQDPYEHGLGATKAIAIPFTNAIPQIAVLDPQACTWCGRCAKACPTDCIDYLQEPQEIDVRATSVIMTTGSQLTPVDAKPQYGQGKLPNVLTPMQVERLLAPHGPYGRVLRPGDGKIPDSIAFVQCAGSRDLSLGTGYCSRVCCMYAIKQAVLLSGSLPIADITIYYMDIRAFGKGYEQFYASARAMGINFVKAKVARITEDDEHNPILRIERQEEDCRVEEVHHDMVVLSLGMVPGADPALFDSCGVHVLPDGFVDQPKLLHSPTLTSARGVFSAGTASGPKDIVDSIMDAGSAAMEALGHIRSTKATRTP
jgi:heterodisulfide reductase subunit A